MPFPTLDIWSNLLDQQRRLAGMPLPPQDEELQWLGGNWTPPATPEQIAAGTPEAQQLAQVAKMAEARGPMVGGSETLPIGWPAEDYVSMAGGPHYVDTTVPNGPSGRARSPTDTSNAYYYAEKRRANPMAVTARLSRIVNDINSGRNEAIAGAMTEEDAAKLPSPVSMRSRSEMLRDPEVQKALQAQIGKKGGALPAASPASAPADPQLAAARGQLGPLVDSRAALTRTLRQNRMEAAKNGLNPMQQGLMSLMMGGGGGGGNPNMAMMLISPQLYGQALESNNRLLAAREHYANEAKWRGEQTAIDKIRAEADAARAKAEADKLAAETGMLTKDPEGFANKAQGIPPGQAPWSKKPTAEKQQLFNIAFELAKKARYSWMRPGQSDTSPLQGDDLQQFIHDFIGKTGATEAEVRALVEAAQPGSDFGNTERQWRFPNPFSMAGPIVGGF